MDVEVERTAAASCTLANAQRAIPQVGTTMRACILGNDLATEPNSRRHVGNHTCSEWCSERGEGRSLCRADNLCMIGDGTVRDNEG